MAETYNYNVKIGITNEELITNVDDHLEYLYGQNEAQEQAIGVAQQTAEDALGLAQGKVKSKTYQSLADMVTDLNALAKDAFKIGDTLYIIEEDVPDFWITHVQATSVTTNSAQTLIDANYTGVQFGYFVVSKLETQKPDLTGVVKTKADALTDDTIVLGAGGQTVKGSAYKITNDTDSDSTDTVPTTAYVKDYYTPAEKKKLAGIDSSLVGVTADDIGKVKDVRVNGSSVLDETTGTANIIIADLTAEYTEATAASVSLNSKTYYAIALNKALPTIEVYNSAYQKIITQPIISGDIVYYCVGTTAPTPNTFYVKKLTGGGVSTGGGVGKNLEGLSVQPAQGTTATAGAGAEIFNDYRDRAYNDSGQVTAGNVASGDYSHAEGSSTTASGSKSHAEGGQTISSGSSSHAEGQSTTASGSSAHAEGSSATASGMVSHAEGIQTTASGDVSHAEGYFSQAIGNYSHAEGYTTKATGNYAHAGGYYTTADNYQCAIGRYNEGYDGPTGTADIGVNGTLFIIGNGTAESARANAFRVSVAGLVYGAGAYNTSGADYAEYFEWADGNPNSEDRRGHFVTLDGDKIRYATNTDTYILGVISTDASVAGDVYSDSWHNMYLKDVYGEKIVKEVWVEETTDENGVVIPAHLEKQWVLNPDYNPDLTYVSRENRPEWSPVGLMGKLVLIDDGTCTANSFCKVAANGTATASTSTSDWRVLKRLDDTHILILFR